MDQWGSSYVLGVHDRIQKKCSRRPEAGFPKPKRKKCAAKEKERNQAINEAFQNLQNRIPHPEGCSEESISENFLPKVVHEMQIKNCYTQRASEEMNNSSSTSNAPSPPLDPGYGSLTPSSSFSNSPIDAPESSQNYCIPQYSGFSSNYNFPSSGLQYPSMENSYFSRKQGFEPDYEINPKFQNFDYSNQYQHRTYWGMGC